MAKLPPIQRLSQEDFTDAPPWLERLLSPINQFFEQIYTTLNKNLTFGDNISSQIRDLEFKTTANYSSTNEWTVLEFESGLKTKVKGVLLAQIQVKSASYVPIVDSVSLFWREESGSVKITFISGLNDSTSYTTRVLVF